MKLTGEETVSQIAALSPEAAKILHRRGLDLCCGGVHPLRMAAMAHGIDLEKVLGELNELEL